MMKKQLIFLLICVIAISCSKKDLTPDETGCGYSGHVKLAGNNTPLDSVLVIGYSCNGPMKYNGKFYCGGDTMIFAEVYTDTGGYFKTPCPTLGLGFSLVKPGFWPYITDTKNNIIYMARFSTLTVKIIDTLTLSKCSFSVNDSITGYHFFSDSISGAGIFTRTDKCGGNVVNRVTFTWSHDTIPPKDTAINIYCPLNVNSMVIFTVPSK